MNTSQIMSGRRPGNGPGDRGLTVAAYVMLFLFGAAQGMLGVFFCSVGPAPFAALGFDLAIFATCLTAAWGLGNPVGAFVPAAGWFAVAFVLASGRKDGSVLVTASASGEVLLFGGAAAAMIGMFVAFTIASWRGIGSGGPGAPGRSGPEGRGGKGS